MFEKCTNENPCHCCDICDMEPGDAICPHGETVAMDCGICYPDICKHQINRNVDQCVNCDAREDAEMQDLDCEHGMRGSCIECDDHADKMDRLAEKAREQDDFNYWHP